MKLPRHKLGAFAALLFAAIAWLAPAQAATRACPSLRARPGCCARATARQDAASAVRRLPCCAANARHAQAPLTEPGVSDAHARTVLVAQRLDTTCVAWLAPAEPARTRVRRHPPCGPPLRLLKQSFLL